MEFVLSRRYPAEGMAPRRDTSGPSPLVLAVCGAGALVAGPETVSYAEDRASEGGSESRDGSGDPAPGSGVEVPPSRFDTFLENFSETVAFHGTIGLRGHVVDDREVGREFSSAWSLGFDGARLALGERPGLVQGARVDLGTTSTGGFLYRYVLNLGVGALLGERAYAGLTLGGGFGGITGGRLGFGLEAPVEVFSVVRLAKRAHLGARGRAQWIFGQSARQGSGPAGLDEYETSAWLEIPFWPDGAVAVGVLAGRQFGGTYVGGTLGASGYLWPGLEERWEDDDREPEPPDPRPRPAARAGASR